MSEGPRHESPPPTGPPAPPPNSPSGSNPAGSPSRKTNGLARLPWIIAWAGSVILAFVLGTQSTGLLGGAATSRPSSTPSAASSATPTAQSTGAQSVEPEVAALLKSLPRRDPNDVTAQGEPNAKVVLIEWSDYRCPFCATWHVQTRPALQKYVTDGTLRIEFRDLPMFGEQSQQAAVAARAAGKQGKFWEYQQTVFAAAPKNGHPDIPRDKLIQFAKRAGVTDITKFEKDLSDSQIAESVAADAQQARDLGISGTPFFVINDGFINGARPTADFIQAIESAAKE